MPETVRAGLDAEYDRIIAQIVVMIRDAGKWLIRAK